jgi:hypothetical protein
MKENQCEQCTSLPEQEGVSLQTSSLDTPLWLQLSGNPTPAKYSEKEHQMAGSPDWLCGKGMSETLTHPSTPGEWTAFMRDSLVRTLARLESKQDLLKEPDRAFTEKSCELLAQLDQMKSSWKMSPQLKAKELKLYSKTWPSWGMTVGGCAYKHPMSGRTITETDGFACAGALKMLPTPTAHNSKEGGYPAEGNRNTPTLAWVIGGKINPQFTEWMMGFPIDFTVSRQSAMRKSHSKRQLPTDCSKDQLPSWLK